MKRPLLLIAAIAAGTLLTPTAEAATDWCGILGPDMTQLADVPTPDVAYALWNVHVPAGATAGFWILNIEGNARHAMATFMREGTNPWTFASGGAYTYGPLMMTKVHASSGSIDQDVAIFADPYEHGEGTKVPALERDRDLSVLRILGAKVPNGQRVAPTASRSRRSRPVLRCARPQAISAVEPSRASTIRTA